MGSELAIVRVGTWNQRPRDTVLVRRRSLDYSGSIFLKLMFCVFSHRVELVFFFLEKNAHKHKKIVVFSPICCYFITIN